MPAAPQMTDDERASLVCDIAHLARCAKQAESSVRRWNYESDKAYHRNTNDEKLACPHRREHDRLMVVLCDRFDRQ